MFAESPAFCTVIICKAWKQKLLKGSILFNFERTILNVTADRTSEKKLRNHVSFHKWSYCLRKKSYFITPILHNPKNQHVKTISKLYLHQSGNVFVSWSEFPGGILPEQRGHGRGRAATPPPPPAPLSSLWPFRPGLPADPRPSRWRRAARRHSRRPGGQPSRLPM